MFGMFLFSNFWHISSREEKSCHYTSEMFTVEAMVRGYYVYKKIWEAVVGGELLC